MEPFDRCEPGARCPAKQPFAGFHSMRSFEPAKPNLANGVASVYTSRAGGSRKNKPLREMVRVLQGSSERFRCLAMMATCPFYRVDAAWVERRKSPRDDSDTKAPAARAPWCAHLHTPVTKYVATVVAGGHRRLRCGGDLAKCQIQPTRRPRL